MSNMCICIFWNMSMGTCISSMWTGKKLKTECWPGNQALQAMPTTWAEGEAEVAVAT